MVSDIDDETPVVSVCLITYNHADYIRECMDSLLCQQTSFPYEICVGEDESSDGTRAICMEYAEKHPGKIRLFLRSQSEPERVSYRSQGVYNYIETSKACRGKYVAQCDGDDAWLDPLKLQKQYDAMEANPSVSMVFSDYAVWYEVTGQRHGSRHERNENYPPHIGDSTRFRCDLVCMNYQIASSSVFMRTQDLLDIFDRNPAIFKSLPMGDTTTWCELLEIGCFLYIDEPLIARRYLAESDSTSRSAERKFKFVNEASNLGVLLGEKYGLPMDAIRVNKVKNCARYAMMSGDLEEISQLHADERYVFPFMEHFLYHAIRFSAFRAAARSIFQLRYRLNNYRFKTP